MLRFKIGDRVVGKAGVSHIGGKIGTVVELSDSQEFEYGIEFDEPIKGGHSFSCEKYKSHHCRWVDDDELDPYIEAALYFANIKVGDSVYDWLRGEGVITNTNHCHSHPLLVNFGKTRSTTYYTLGGVAIHCDKQSLFYSKPVFDLPPPPKRTVKKVVEGWMNIYKHTVIGLYDTEVDADKATSKDRLGKAHLIRHEYDE